MNRPTKNRRALLATLLTGSLVLSATGCANRTGSRFASLNPFSKSTSTASQTSPGVTESIAQGTKTVWKKSGEAVTGLFASAKLNTDTADAESDVDPLRLDRKVEVDPEVLVANGRLWESTGNFQKAMENYTKALEREPNYPDALTNIARLHFRQGNHTQAADFFGRSIKQNPKDAGLYNDLGLTLSKMGNYAAAQQTLSRALELAPGTSRYANNLASVKFESGDKDGAFKVLEANNKPAVAHFNMAYLNFKAGETKDAQQHLTSVMKFATDANQDAAVKQAVDRAREMLAQLSGPQATIAKAAPPTTGLKSGIRQTSQSASGDTGAKVAPATGTTSIPSAKVVEPSFEIEKLTATESTIPEIPATAEPPLANQEQEKGAAADSASETTSESENVFALPPSFQMPSQ